MVAEVEVEAEAAEVEGVEEEVVDEEVKVKVKEVNSRHAPRQAGSWRVTWLVSSRNWLT